VRGSRAAPRVAGRARAPLTPPPPLPRRHQLALYFNVTGIRWDYEAGANIAAGVIAPADGLPPRALRVDPAALPAAGGVSASVALADALWADICAAHGGA